MKIFPAAATLAQAFGWFVCAALAPLAAQTDDHADTAAAATTMGINVTTSGVLNSSTDVDYLKFTLAAAGPVAIFSTGTTNTVGSLRTAADAEIASNDNGGSFTNFWMSPELAAGTYLLRVTGSAGATGSYAVRVESPLVPDDYGDTVATAKTIGLGTTQSVTLGSPTDVDYFSFSLTAETRVAISSTGVVDTIGSLRNRTDLEMAVNDDTTPTNKNFRIVRSLQAGTYFVRVSAYERDMGSFTFRIDAAPAATVPVVTTLAASNVTTTSAILSGNVTSDGDAPATQRGVVYGTTANPAIGGTGVVAVTSASGPGAFTVSSGVLTPLKHYYARAFATNSVGTGYGSQVEFFTLGAASDDHANTSAGATPVGAPSATPGSLNSASDVDYFRFTLNAAARVTLATTGTTDTYGSLRDSADKELTANDQGGTVPNFTIVTDLAAGTYFVAVSGAGGATGAYTFVVETAIPGTARLLTAAAANVTANGATLGGSVVSEGTSTVTQRGIVFGTLAGPELGNPAYTTLASGAGYGGFSLDVANLKSNSVYFLRTFAVNGAGTNYGPEIQFTTPPVTTAIGPNDDHGDTAAVATLVGPVSRTPGVIESFSDVDYFKFVLPVDSPVLVASLGTIQLYATLRNGDDAEIAYDFNSGGGGNFRFDRALAAGTYYVRVTGTGSGGNYQLLVEASVTSVLPAVTTTEASAIAPRQATLGGVVTFAGGVPVTQRGVVYGTSPSPQVGAAGATAVASGDGTGSFATVLAGLQPGTGYHARAFAINSVGVGYGAEVQFTTLPDDHGETAATATLAVSHTSSAGALERAGDVDYFRFVLPGAMHVVVSTSGNVDTLGSLRDASDQEITADDNSAGSGNFRIERDLAAGTYHVRVSAVGGATGAYTLRFEASIAPTVTTAAPAGITPSSALLGGSVSSDGGAAVTQRGVVLGLMANPTVGSGTVAGLGSGPGSFSDVIGSLQPETQYHVRAFAVNAAGTGYGGDVVFTTPHASRLMNLSIRASSGDGAATLIVGFQLAGAGAGKPMLVRVVGPGLTRFGVTGTLDDPFLQLASAQSAIASNENWDGSAAIVAATASVGAFPLAAGSRDAALLPTLSSNTYTVRASGGTGLALVEVYDPTPGVLPKLTNVSTRAAVGTGANVLIAGFTLTGPLAKMVLVRGIGPTLATFQVGGVLADPRLEVFASGSATPVATNDNWGGTAALSAAFARAGAFVLPADSRDAALVVSLPPGSYTVQVSGVGNTTGIGLVELYELP